jgi:hypothetical protein
VVPEEEPSPVSASFSLGALDERLVVGFIDGFLPAIRTYLEIVQENQMDILRATN